MGQHRDNTTPRRISVAGVLVDHLHTTTSAGTHRAGRRPRHLTGRQTVLVVTVVVAALALLAPLLLLTPLAPGSPQALKDDPAVAALHAYESGLDRSPAHRAAAATAARTLTLTTLADGTVHASRLSPTGQCYYLLIPPTPDLPPSGVRAGTPSDCT